MSLLPLPSDDELSPEAARLAATGSVLAGPSSTAAAASISNAARALLVHPASFAAYAQWSVLKDELVPFIGERAVNLFSYVISDEVGAALCAAYFRRALVEGGEDPDDPQVTETERTLLAWGRAIARAPEVAPAQLTDAVLRAFSPRLRTMLVAFAGQTVALTVFTAQGLVPIDDDLTSFVRNERTAS